jgi:hypothetical protein
VLSFALVLVGSGIWLGETIATAKVVGVGIIAVGLIVGTR